jgi:hypothetical protein
MYDLGGWVGVQGSDFVTDLAVTSGSAVVTSQTAYFRANVDEGTGISGAGIPAGTTILSVQSATQATMSANANASGTGVFAAFTNRRDPDLLTYDLLHPGDRGHQWIADELIRLLAGLPRLSTIPQGIFDNKGEMLAGASADSAGKFGPGIDGQIPTAAANALNGVLFQDVWSSNRGMQVLANTAGTTFTTTGFSAAATVTSGVAAANADAAWGPAVRISTTTTSGNVASLVTPNCAQTRWAPEFGTLIAIPTITSQRSWIGLFSGDPSGSATPSVHLAAFRYDTGADGTAFWRCVTAAGTATQTVTTTTVAVTAGTAYRLRIEVNAIATSIKFYINDILVGTHTTNLPTTTTSLAARESITTLSAASRTMDISRLAVSHV